MLVVSLLAAHAASAPWVMAGLADIAKADESEAACPAQDICQTERGLFISATIGQGSPLYQACLLAVSLHNAKIRAASGKLAVHYQGSSRRGASQEPETIFKEVELPLLSIRASKLPELQVQVDKALKALAHKAKFEAEAKEFDKLLLVDLKTFAKRMSARQCALHGLPVSDDTAQRRYANLDKLSKLSN